MSLKINIKIDQFQYELTKFNRFSKKKERPWFCSLPKWPGAPFRLCWIPQTFNVSLCEIPALKYIWSMDCPSFPMLLLHPFLCCSFSEFWKVNKSPDVTFRSWLCCDGWRGAGAGGHKFECLLRVSRVVDETNQPMIYPLDTWPSYCYFRRRFFDTRSNMRTCS